MRKVVTIDLSGHLYQLDEQGYGELRAYLAQAEARLGANPDKTEILRDLEQSIGEKLLRYIGPEQSVAGAAEVSQILHEIGPVEGGADAGAPGPGAAAQNQTGATAPPPRLYLIQDGAIIGGLCNGIASYFQVDPTLVRVVFVVSAVMEMMQFDRPPVLIGGFYLLLMFLVPYAKPASTGTVAGATHVPIPQKVRRGVERVKAAFGGLQHNPH